MSIVLGVGLQQVVLILSFLIVVICSRESTKQHTTQHLTQLFVKMGYRIVQLSQASTDKGEAILDVYHQRVLYDQSINRPTDICLDDINDCQCKVLQR